MERQKMKKRGFTLVELLVVIAIIAMLLAILMPALGKVRQLAQRIMCSTNLSGIGKAMLTYSSDDKYESFPISGSAGSYWDRGPAGGGGTVSWDWREPKAFPETTGTQSRITISSCLYLLVKYADVSPDQFVCSGSDQKKFELRLYDMTGIASAPTNVTLTDVWDMGKKASPGGEITTGVRAKGHNSYSYELPSPIGTTTALKSYVHPVSATTNPAKALMADRNPFWEYGSNAKYYVWDSTNKKITPDSIPAGNNTYHQNDGQNVLYADQHAKFEKIANCGIEGDNIYTVWGTGILNLPTDEPKRQCGGPTLGTVQTDNAWAPQNENDNYLVSDLDKDI
jgi:prepilin-type N-terminal cleavage/methylation domain-containing protein